MIQEKAHEFQPNPRAFLEHFPPDRRGPIANVFHYAVRQGIQPATRVLLTVREAYEWRQDRDALQVLAALRTDPAGALAYAQSVLDYERLPADQRQRVKAERAVHFLTESMRTRPVTEPQRAYLQALGYAGPPPANRAEASQLIDRLRRERRGA